MRIKGLNVKSVTSRRSPITDFNAQRAYISYNSSETNKAEGVVFVYSDFVSTIAGTDRVSLHFFAGNTVRIDHELNLRLNTLFRSYSLW